MRIAFLSVNRQIASSLSAPEAFRASGNNLGNMVFVNALADQIRHENGIFSYKLDAGLINNDYDAVVIPAANWLNPAIDMSGFHNAIKDIRKPCIVIGIGAQSESYEQIPDLPAGSRKFLDFISAKSTMIGARGHYSTKVLHHYGYTSGITTGCPSLYWNCSPYPPRVVVDRSAPPQRIAVQGTRHNIPNLEFFKTGMAAHQRGLIRQARQSNLDYIIQSEFEEFVYAKGDGGGDQASIEKRLEAYYEENLAEGLGDYLRHRMHYFYDVALWLNFLKQLDFLVTSRIHGCIMALYAGLPALLVWHDTRTREIAEYAGLPHMSHGEYLKVQGMAQLYDKLDYHDFYYRYSKNYSAYVDFLNANGLDHNMA